VLHPEPVELLDVLAAELLEKIPPHQLVAECDEYARLNFLAADRATIRARSTRSGVEAREAIPPEHDVTAAALGAFRQPGEQELGPSRPLEVGLLAICERPHGGLPCLHLIPQLILDDAQLRHFGRNPFGRGIQPGDALARVGIFQVAQTVPDHSTDVELVVEDARSPVAVPVNGARIPYRAPGRRYALRVETLGDGLG
jgi:hypothetical protein